MSWRLLLTSYTTKVIFIFFVTFLVYFPALNGGFVWDDDTFLTENPLIKVNDGLYRFWFTTDAPDYFPLVSTSLWLQWRLWGMDPFGYHAVNIFIHSINSILLWLCLNKLRVPGAWLAGLFFAIHPVNVESVAWISEHKNTVPMFFFLLSIIFYLKYETLGYYRYYLASISSFLLALFSKPSIIMLPLLLLGYALWKRGRVTPKDIRQTIPFFVLSILFGFITIWFQYYNSIGVEIIRTDSFLLRLVNSGRVIWFYLYKAFFPYRLIFIYPGWKTNSLSLFSFLPLIAITAFLTFFWRFRKGWGRQMMAVFGYYTISLFPVLGFFDVFFMKYSIVADHWQYTSIAGIVALLAAFIVYIMTHWNRRFRPFVLISLALIIISFASQTWSKGYIYKNEETLWRDTLSKNNSAWLAHNNLGIILANRGELDEANFHYFEALKAKQEEYKVYNNIGNILVQKGEFEEAATFFSRSRQINPNYINAYINLGNVMSDMGNLDEAIAVYKEALRIDPSNAYTHYNMGKVLSEQGDFDRAVVHYTEAVRIKPQFMMSRINLGFSLAKQGSLEEAIHQYSVAFAQRPLNRKSKATRDMILRTISELYQALIIKFRKKNDNRGFISAVDKWLEIDPQNITAYGVKAAFYYELGDKDKARELFRAILEIDPYNKLAKESLVIIEK